MTTERKLHCPFCHEGPEAVLARQAIGDVIILASLFDPSLPDERATRDKITARARAYMSMLRPQP